jgi:restriction system protein
MPRRSPKLIDDIAAAPWPVGAVAGVLVLIAGKGLVPWIFSESPNRFLAAIARSLESGSLDTLLWLFAAICWLGAVAAFLGQRKRHARLEAQVSLDTLRAMSWREFEHLVADAYRRLGFNVQETTQSGADGGVDLLLRRDGRLSLVQCKLWRTQRVGVPTIREQFGLLTHLQADNSIIVTAGDFTSEARAFASGKPIELVAGPDLLVLVQSVQRTAKTAPSAITTAVPVAIDSNRSCPQCGSAMVRRTARRTRDAFFGCSAYPRCRGTRPLKD